eukprot:Colp12_sorted_trinity150504_noHs@3981
MSKLMHLITTTDYLLYTFGDLASRPTAMLNVHFQHSGLFTNTHTHTHTHTHEVGSYYGSAAAWGVGEVWGAVATLVQLAHVLGGCYRHHPVLIDRPLTVH